LLLYFYAQKDLKYNIILSATAEEKFVVNGVESILKHLGNLEFAIVGEPTEMQLAVAEKGLLVLDCIAKELLHMLLTRIMIMLFITQLKMSG
jgi:acetylornithine deacetylase